MKKKILRILISGLFLFGIGVNNVKADDPAGESTIIPGQAEEAPPVEDNSGVSGESTTIPGQAEEAPPVEDNSGATGENATIPQTAEEAPPAQLIIQKTEDGEFNLLGIIGTVKDKEFVKGCGGEIEFLVLTTDSKLYYGIAENNYPAKYNSDIQMKEVQNDSTKKIKNLSYTLGGLGCSTLVPSVKFEDNTMKRVNYSADHYTLIDTSVDEAQSVTIGNKIYYFGIFKASNEEIPSTLESAKIKEYMYAYDCGGELYIAVLTDDLRLYASPNITSESDKTAILMYSVSNDYKGKIAGFVKYNAKEYATITNQKSYCMANIGVKFEDKKIYSLQYNETKGLYLDTKYECAEDGSTTVKNPKTGNYIPYTFGLLFIIISSVGLFALKNRKVFNK